MNLCYITVLIRVHSWGQQQTQFYTIETPDESYAVALLTEYLKQSYPGSTYSMTWTQNLQVAPGIHRLQ